VTLETKILKGSGREPLWKGERGEKEDWRGAKAKGTNKQCGANRARASNRGGGVVREAMAVERSKEVKI
jgi:hypothetical protein